LLNHVVIVVELCCVVNKSIYYNSQVATLAYIIHCYSMTPTYLYI